MSYYFFFFYSGYRSKNGRENGYTMSKYRRKAANAKERDRMKLVNEAFERLRDVVPETQETQNVTVGQKKVHLENSTLT